MSNGYSLWIEEDWFVDVLPITQSKLFLELT